MVRRDLHEENRRSWNAATRAHNSHKLDQAGFLRGGGSTLFPEEVDLVGEVNGKRLLHLCCNSGQDTLSFVQRGALATGIDISDEAIDEARRLSTESGLPATFLRGDVYDVVPEVLVHPERFDVVFFSYGALCWLSDVPAIFRLAREALKPGGRLVVVEFHPTAYIFDEQLVHRYAYSSPAPLPNPKGVGDYVGASKGALSPSGHVEGAPFSNPHGCHEFIHGLGDVVKAALSAGLTLERLEEWPYANGCAFFENMELQEGRRYVLPASVPSLPLMYGLVARV